MTISQDRIDAAGKAYIANIDNPDFCEGVGIRQELHLRTDMKGDTDGAFAVAVEEQLAA